MRIKRVKEAWKLEPSPLVQRFTGALLEAAKDNPILDVGCGSGRHAFFLAALHARVIAVDRDVTAIQGNMRLARSIRAFPTKRLETMAIELRGAAWPFEADSLGGIVAVHFPGSLPFPKLARSLVSGGCLLLQTIPGHGRNYLDLPKRGQLKAALEKSFELACYEERQVGPAAANAVTVRLFARRPHLPITPRGQRSQRCQSLK